MKLNKIIAVILMTSRLCQAETKPTELPRQFPLLGIEYQNVVVVTADFDHPKPCPQKLTNLLTNTKLFTKEEQARILDVIERYQNVTTNIGPVGSVFTKWGVREVQYDEQYSEKIPIAYFTCTNSETTVEVWKQFDLSTYVRTRNSSGDGFDINLESGNGVLSFVYQEYTKGVMNGLCVCFSDFRDLEKTRCVTHCRFQNGKIFGSFIGWKRTDIDQPADTADILMEAKFKKPFDILSHNIRPIDIAWAFENPINFRKIVDEFTRRSKKTEEWFKEYMEKGSR